MHAGSLTLFATEVDSRGWRCRLLQLLNEVSSLPLRNVRVCVLDNLACCRVNLRILKYTR